MWKERQIVQSWQALKAFQKSFEWNIPASNEIKQISWNKLIASYNIVDFSE